MISDSYSQLVWRTYAAVKEMELTEKECGRRGQEHLGGTGKMDV